MRKDSQESAYRYLEYTYEVSHQIMQKSKNKCLSGGGRGKGPYPTPFHLVVLFQKEQLRNLDLADKIDCNVKS